MDVSERPPLYPHQVRGLAETWRAFDEEGFRAVCLTAPMGAGKSRIAEELIHEATRRNWPVALYVHRRMLVDQMIAKLAEGNIDVGVRAAGYDPALLRDVQVCSIWTENSRVFRKKKRELHKPKLVIVDELHQVGGAIAKKIFKHHLDEGALLFGMTGTPVDLASCFEKLIVCAVNSDLRACGAQIPAIHYGCEEPDLRRIKRLKDGNFSPSDISKAMHIWQIFGRVFEHWQKLNPNQLPTILFAPGVKESIFFAREFCKHDVAAAHIDGTCVYFNECCPTYAGEEFEGESGMEKRHEVAKMCEAGDIKVVCNRFVLREGVDWRFLAHSVLATAFGALHTYLQAGARVLRSYPGLEFATIQDHGGNWHRHGSLNEDREWWLGCTGVEVSDLRKQQYIQGEQVEPTRCPQCGAIRGRTWASAGMCPQCGFSYEQSVRPVIQTDGSLKMMKGSVYGKRRTDKREDAQKRWDRFYFGAKKSGKTFAQAEAWYAHENRWQYPSRGLANMPLTASDWLRRVADVPRERLRSVSEAAVAEPTPFLKDF